MRCLAWGLLLLATQACVGTETGNPGFTGTLEYNAYTSQPTSVALRSGEDGSVIVRSAWLVLGDVDFVPADDCDTMRASDVHADGIGAGDHAAEGAVKTPVELLPGEYCAVRVPLLRSGDDVGAAPAALAGHSIYLEAVLLDGRVARVRSTMNTSFVLEASDESFALTEESGVVLVGFDVAAWIGGLDWSDAQVNADGTIDVDASHNTALLTEIEQRLDDGVALFRDDAQTGEVPASATPIARVAR